MWLGRVFVGYVCLCLTGGILLRVLLYNARKMPVPLVGVVIDECPCFRTARPTEHMHTRNDAYLHAYLLMLISTLGYMRVDIGVIIVNPNVFGPFVAEGW